MKIIKASAGSGKTYRLAYEYIRTVVQQPQRYRSTLGVTFTNKATEEMKSRVVKELAALSESKTHTYMKDLCSSLDLTPETVMERAKKALSMILHDYSRFGIMTIDRFFQKMVRGFVKELDLDNDYRIDLNTDYLLSLAVDSLIDTVERNPSQKKRVYDYVDNKIENGKSRDFKRELTEFAHIILRPEFDTYPQGEKMELMEKFLVVADERCHSIPKELKKMASEAIRRIAEAGLSEADFYQKGKGIYGYLSSLALGGVKYEPGKYTVDSLSGEPKYWKSSQAVKDTLIDTVRKMIALAREYRNCSIVTRFFREYLILGDVAQRLDGVLKDNNVMILSMTDMLLSKLTKENDAPFIYEKSGVYFDTFLIDEFQDTSVEQWQNFAPLINEAIAQTEDGRNSVIVVGDTKQSIYRWRGGDWRLIEGDLEKDLNCPEGISIDNLDTNYRSRRGIIRFNNSLMRSVVDTYNRVLDDMLTSARESGHLTFEQDGELRGLLAKAYEGMEQGYSPDNSDCSGYVRVLKFEKEDGESGADMKRRIFESMTKEIERLQDNGYRASDMAILVRTTDEAQEAASFLLDYKRSHPENEKYCYEVVSSEVLKVNASPVVRFIIAAFGLAMNLDDGVSLALFNRYLGRTPAEEPTEKERDILASLRSMSLEEAFELLSREYNLGGDKRDVAYLQAFHSILLAFSDQAADIPSFMEMWSHQEEKKYISLPEGQDSITIQTIHKAKGLQYKIIFLPLATWSLGVKSGSKIMIREPQEPYGAVENLTIGSEKGLLDTPFAYSYIHETVMTAIESINILYVALTRAVDSLFVAIPVNGGSDSVGGLIGAAIGVEGDKAVIRNTAPSAHDNSIEGVAVTPYDLRFGEPTLPKAKKEEKKSRQIFFDDYHSLDYTKRLSVHLGAARYLDDGALLTPRSYGVRMHRLFENSRTEEDVYKALDLMESTGELTRPDKELLKIRIDEAFANPVLKEIFSSENACFTERNILLPLKDKPFRQVKGGSVSSPSHLFARPDRVVMAKNVTYVLDYKFGNSRADYHKQMERYMRLLAKMGYPEPRGYIWYVALGDFVEVKLSDNDADGVM